MAEIVIMPKLGFNMSTGKLVKWYKAEGEEIKKGEAFFAIETDKTNIDIESTGDGIVKKLFISEGDSIEVTLPIAIIGGKSENVQDLIAQVLSQLGKESEIESSILSSEPPKIIEQTTPIPETKDLNFKITPRARKAAAERNIDITLLNIKGRGYQGGISEADILAFAEAQPKPAKISPLAKKIAAEEGVDTSMLTGTGVDNKIMKRDIEAVLQKSQISTEDIEVKKEDLERTPDGKEILENLPYSGVRRIIGERLSESKVTAPHVYFTRSVDLSNLLELRKQINSVQDHKTSVTDFIATAVTKTLQKYPDVNASLQGDQIIKYKTVNLGLAVAADNGLIVPNIKDAEKRNLLSISKEAVSLIDKARKGKLSPQEYTGGTFTISNLGMFGIENFTAIINPPESAILAVSATEKRPVVIEDENGKDVIVIKPMMNITLSIDHRLIDGLLAAQFVGEIRDLLENPIKLVL